MWSLLSKALIILMIALFIPTGLVLASQDAVPGDRTYPIKRDLENVIITLASLHPTTRAFFKADMAGRRYKEAVALIKRGDEGSTQSLTELVTQTQAATEDISKISDPSTKQQLVDNLSKQIVQYKAGLTQLETIAPPVIAAPQPAVQTVNQVPTQPSVIIMAPTATPTSAPSPVESQTPTQAGISAQPTIPVVPPPPSVQPPVPPSSISSTIDNLNEIEDQLKALKKNDEQDSSNKQRKKPAPENSGNRSHKSP